MKRLAQFQQYYKDHENYFSIGFFISGFAFDLIMIQEIDELFSVVQQIFYLFVIGGVLYCDSLLLFEKIKIPSWLQKAWEYRMALVHFALGTLLNIYSIFYFKSSSLLSSFVFMILISVILIANENHSVKKIGLWPKFLIYTLCLNAFFSMMIPVVLGFIGWIPFALAVFITTAVLLFFITRIKKQISDKTFLRKQILLPTLGVEVLFISFYLLGWIPPVPLSAKFMGIYHKIEKENGQYLLYHQRPRWKIWQNGDQTFLARSGDPIYFFTNIYSPARFSDEVRVRWIYDDPKLGWTPWDLIPMKISGGREEGFRGFTYKNKYAPGKWRVQLETTDGREIGRIYFDVIPDTSTGERSFLIDEK